MLFAVQVAQERERSKIFAMLIRLISEKVADLAENETVGQGNSLSFSRTLLAHLQELFEAGFASHDGAVPERGLPPLTPQYKPPPPSPHGIWKSVDPDGSV